MSNAIAPRNNQQRQQQPTQIVRVRRAASADDLTAAIEAVRSDVKDVLPKHLSIEKLMRNVVVAWSKTPVLQECSIESICRCFIQASQLGLDCSGVLGSAYMVPFYNKDVRHKEAQLIPGYRGLIELARRTGEIEKIMASVVYECDEFSHSSGTDERIVHVPKYDGDRSDEKIIAAYMIAWTKGSNRPTIEVMTRAEIEKAKKVSGSAGSGFSPWKGWFPEMCRKTVCRKGMKYLPMSIDLSAALRLEEEYDAAVRVISLPPQSDIPPAPTVGAAGLLEKMKQTKPDPDEEIGDAIEPELPEGAPNVLTWESTWEELVSDEQVDEQELWGRVRGWLTARGVRRGKEVQMTSIDDRIALVEAARDGRLMPDGSILEKGDGQGPD